MIAFILGIATGVMLGWMVLYLMMAFCSRTKEPKTKDEWKVM